MGFCKTYCIVFPLVMLTFLLVSAKIRAEETAETAAAEPTNVLKEVSEEKSGK